MTNKQYIFLGPQGSGKGTQAKVLADWLRVPHISTGDLFREQIAKSTVLGQQVSAVLTAGQLVSDDLTNQIVASRLAQPDAANGFILDGYPRNLDQAKFLDSLASEVVAVVLNLSDDEAVHRLIGRRTCSKCGVVYHVEFNPPTVANICNNCGGSLRQRTDDTETVIRDRLVIYHKQTEPLVQYYKTQHRLIEIDGTPTITQVTLSIKQTLSL